MTRGQNFRNTVMGGLLCSAVLLAGLVPSTLAAQDMDSRWLPFLGCWEAVEAGEEAPLLCVRPAAEGNGVDFVTWTDGELSAPETILADGVPRSAERQECQGIEEARFSDDGHRIYLKSTYVCEGETEREASGILAMLNPMEWADIKSVEGTPWVLKYRLARASRIDEAGVENVVAPRASEVKAARIAASARLTEEDIIEAVGQVEGAAVEALIVERGDAFAVNADLLIRLDDADVPAGVIDLMVAISYPDRFAVKAGPMPVEEYADEAPRRMMYMGSGFMTPWYGNRYSPWGYGLGYGYGGYGYGYGGYGYGGYGYGGGYGGGYYQPRPIVVSPRTSGNGSMVKGRGYTRGGAGSGYTGGTARSRGGSSSGGSRATASPGVRSSGGSSSGRTAKPRGGTSGGVSSSTRSSSSSASKAKARTAKPRGGLL